MKCLYVFFVGLVVLISAGVRLAAEMPYVLCIPASEMAKERFQTQSEQIEFLRGFRRGVELQLTDSESVSHYMSRDDLSPFVQGCKMGITAVSERGRARLNVSLSDLGYSLLGWKKGRLSLGGEDQFFTFSDSGEIVAFTIAPFAWNNWKDAQRKNADPTGEIWIRGWLSPEASFQVMRMAKRSVYITEMYRYVPPSPELKKKR